MTMVLDGRLPAKMIKQKLIDTLTTIPVNPKLAIVLVGQNPASLTYIKHKQKFAAAIGVDFQVIQMNSDSSSEQVIGQIEQLNSDPSVHGIIVQLPLPNNKSPDSILAAILPSKDVDGLSPTNAGRLAQGQGGIVPATARGVVALLEHYRIPLRGQQIVVVGRSRLVGVPLGLLCLKHDATVTIAHRHTDKLDDICRGVDIIVAAAGQPGLINQNFVTNNSIIVDVGINRTEDGIVGDVSPAIYQTVQAYSPVPGGVGPLTVACLYQNLIEAARKQLGPSR